MSTQTIGHSRSCDSSRSPGNRPLSRIRFASLAIALPLSLQLLASVAHVASAQPSPKSEAIGGALNRPLRYTPDGTDFVITNGSEFFNRPLYGGSSGFRVDAGDMPEFSLYLPGRGGNLRLGLRAGNQIKWLHQAREIVARYRPGSMVYEIRDPLLGDGFIDLTAITTRTEDGFMVRVTWSGSAQPPELLLAFGGVNGMRGRRGGDIGCEREPVAQFFQLRPEQCSGNVIETTSDRWTIRAKPGVVGGVVSGDATLQIGAAANWSTAETLFNSPDAKSPQPVAMGVVRLRAGQPVFLGIQRLASGNRSGEVAEEARETGEQTSQPAQPRPPTPWQSSGLAALFAKAEAQRQALAQRVSAQTPDPFLNAAVAALNVAADAVWDDHQQAYLHGGVAWRVRLLGWRVAYAGDALGWHDRTARHFEGFARQQNTNPVPTTIPSPEAAASLSRNETALHSNGDLTKSHYDMNLVGMDTFFRHLLWTGDLDYARRWWPVIERHMAWERRLFRREFGPEKLPLYEAYCCIWASDDLACNGGGATHASAYNLYHNRMAARVAKMLGTDPSTYEHEAELISRGMQEDLWLQDRGWYAEWKDLLGLQLVHPNAAVWTFYHTLDSGVPSRLQAWQMTRFVDTQIPQLPLQGRAVPAGCYTLPTTSWMPYRWSLNNVVMAETMHTALAYWQANRPEGAWPLFKGALLDSMYVGLCPGNVGMCTGFDANRKESQRDFGDGCGALARTLVEGLFGVHPDLLAGTIELCPGFPAGWNTATLRHPDFDLRFTREGDRETYSLETRFAKPLKLVLQAAALRDRIARVTVNGRPANWRMLDDFAGLPRIGIDAPASEKQKIVIEWSGDTPVAMPSAAPVSPGGELRVECGARIQQAADPQRSLDGLKISGTCLTGRATGTPGHRTLFVQLAHGNLCWWQPVPFEIRAPTGIHAPIDWAKPLPGRFETVDLRPFFNDQATRIFRNEYRAPRSPFCSLATPMQGFGSWCHPQDTFEVDDSGLRALAAKSDDQIRLPNGVPFATPSQSGARNITFVSQWDNYPREFSLPLTGTSAHAFLLMAGSTGPMQSQFDNGEVIVTYVDGSVNRLALRNPTTWWPINEDYFIDDLAFRYSGPLPVRVDLRTGRVRILRAEEFKGQGHTVPGGAATVLDLPLDASKPLKSLTVRALANEVVIGLMSVTLQR